ncbi:MAG: hypothetical protein OXN23_08140 [Gammaproteobacteria bacterium]|nr:hypothetical protein [Gammaproteobacteria bacterium]
MSDLSSWVAVESTPRWNQARAGGGDMLQLELLRRSGAFRSLAARVAEPGLGRHPAWAIC